MTGESDVMLVAEPWLVVVVLAVAVEEEGEEGYLHHLS
jgi:hypothetical protein